MSTIAYSFAKALIDMQNKEIRKLHGFRFVENGYEYRLSYCGGFYAMMEIERREVGKRNFKWFRTIGCYGCRGAEGALRKVMESVSGEGGNK